MTLLTESDLAKNEPSFLWRSPTAYRVLRNGSNTTLAFGRLTRFDRFSIIGLFAVMSLVGVVEIFLGWPLYVAILPLAVIAIGMWLGAAKRKRLEGCVVDVTAGGVFITTPANRLELPPLVEVRVQNRWKRRDGSFIVDGDSELFLAVKKTQGHTLFFPLANAGVLRDLDALASDIARAAGCQLNKELIK